MIGNISNLHPDQRAYLAGQLRSARDIIKAIQRHAEEHDSYEQDRFDRLESAFVSLGEEADRLTREDPIVGFVNGIIQSNQGACRGA